MRKLWILSFLLFGLAFAQGKIEDKVIARVGDEVITLSELEELYQRYRLLYPGMDEKELKKSILEELINNKLIVHAAKQDTTISKISDAEIEDALESRIKMLEQQYGPENFSKMLESQGLTRNQLKDLYRENIREELLVQKYIDKYIRPKIQITPQEVKNFYDTYKDSLKEPDTYRIAHVLISVKPDSQAEKEAYNRAMNLWNQIRKGASFEDIANRYSDDRESASYGGMIGVVPKSYFPPEVQAKLDSLKVGEVSEPIRGDFGYHIFKMVGKDENSYQLKHILVKVEAKSDQWNKAYQKALSIKNKIDVQKVSFEDLAKQYSDDEDTKDLGGDLGWIPLPSLPQEFREKLANAKVGDIVIVKSQDGYHVVKVLDKKLGKVPEFSEVQNNIRQYIENAKIQEELNKLILQLREKILVEVKEF